MRFNRLIMFCAACAAGLAAGPAAALAQAAMPAAIPEAAWRIPIGSAPANPGTHKPELSGQIIDDGYWQGAPVGGLGAGTFSRTQRGHFERWHVKAGVHKYQDVPNNQFAVFAQPEGGSPVAMALAADKPSGWTMTAWNWSYPAGDGEYAALYPRSWYSYATRALPVKLTVEQFSPVLPENYKESSYPVAVYRWTAENPSSRPVTVSILFSWTNMVGWFRDQTRNFDGALNQQNIDRFVEEKTAAGAVRGVVFDRLRRGPVTEEWDGQFAIAALEQEGVEVSYLATYAVNGDGGEVWRPFSRDGRLPNDAPPVASSGDPLAGAIAVRFTLGAHETRTVPMALSWDLPVVQFGGGRKWLRHYTHFVGTEGTHAFALARTALEHAEEWSRAIDAWQKPIVTDQRRPAWYRAELFNELYDLADGGSFWGCEKDPPANPVHVHTRDRDTFSWMESYDYPFYGSSDVRFYGSWGLLKWWPELEKQEMLQFADTIPEELGQLNVWAWKSWREGRLVSYTRKTAGSAPHDLGAPGEDPFVNVNQYNYQDVSNWRDLNSKYVLMVWRDYALTGAADESFLKANWPAVKLAMEHLRQYDTDGDGLIENGGFPDQTYDGWVATGESAYTGGLYLAALKATARMAEKLGETKTADDYDALEARSAKAYIRKLWTGQYFRYSVLGPDNNASMAEQLAGQWYADLTGLGELVPKDMRHSALKMVWELNVRKFAKGEMGAVNGVSPEGSTLRGNDQQEEVWTGTTFGLASHMIAEGMRDQGFATAKGVNNVVWRDRGYFFRTPEAYDNRGLFRASMYMRPMAIWAMEYALEKK